MATKKTVFLTGSSGNMGFAGFKELYAKKDKFNIVLLNRGSEKNRKLFAPYENDPCVKLVWGDLTNYEDVLEATNGADYVLHVGGMVSPAADYYPVKTQKTNVTAAQNIVEAVFAESGLKHWVSLRQSGILYPAILKNLEPIMYHVPINGVLEWATVEDSGRLLANVCGDDIPEEFWRRFYNIGSGEEYRITNYEFEELLLGTLGLGSPKKLFDPHWFTTRNFHGQWYYDGDELEKYCHFRANIPVKEYFKSMMNNVESFYKLAFLAKPFAPILKKLWMKKIAETPEYGTLWWAENKVDVRMKAYYGSMEEYNKLPRTWDKFDIIIPSKKTTSSDVKILDHGYDESKDFNSLTLEDLQKAAAFRGGECLATEIVDMYTPVKWKSARGNEFEMSPNLVLRGGHWCPEELPWPWDYDTEARINPFFAQVWDREGENNVYGPEIFDNFKEKVTQ